MGYVLAYYDLNSQALPNVMECLKKATLWLPDEGRWLELYKSQG